jgi:hypothetical protein
MEERLNLLGLVSFAKSLAPKREPGSASAEVEKCAGQVDGIQAWELHPYRLEQEERCRWRTSLGKGIKEQARHTVQKMWRPVGI